MTRGTLLLPPVVTLLALGAPATGRAQSRPDSWAALSQAAPPTVFVELASGDELKGRLLRIDSDALVLQLDHHEERIHASQIVRVSKPGDSVKDGAIIGAVVGAVMGGLATMIADCPSNSRSCTGTRVTMGVVSIGLYSLVGAGIDALHQGRTTLYEAPTRRNGVALDLRAGPIRGGSATLGWTCRW